MRLLLEDAVSSDRSTGKAARVAGVRVAGKTGTSDTGAIFANFVGMVPADRPRFVIFVGVSAPSREGSGGTIAAPLFSRIATRALSG
jgi:cell division protein FtsI (penicillin-binding protein 3)